MEQKFRELSSYICYNRIVCECNIKRHSWYALNYALKSEFLARWSQIRYLKLNSLSEAKFSIWCNLCIQSNVKYAIWRPSIDSVLEHITNDFDQNWQGEHDIFFNNNVKSKDDWPFILIHIMWTYREGVTWKRNAYNEIYSGNRSLNVYICLTTA